MSICGAYAFSGWSFSAVHMHFLGQAFLTKKAKFFCFFSIKKSSVRWKTSRISKSEKYPSAKTAKFQNLQKRKILNSALGFHYSGCSVVPGGTSLRTPVITESVCNLVVLPQRHYKTLCACYYQSALWRQCVLVLYGLRVWFKHWNLKQCSVQQEQIQWTLHEASCMFNLLIFSISL